MTCSSLPHCLHFIMLPCRSRGFFLLPCPLPDVLALSLAFPFDVGQSIFVRPEESFSFAFASLVEVG